MMAYHHGDVDVHQQIPYFIRMLEARTAGASAESSRTTLLRSPSLYTLNFAMQLIL
jgi:hypothetical protein